MKRLFSLSIIIIAALIFWGSQTWEKKTAIKNLETSDPHYIDVFINDFTITAMSEDGKPDYILKAKRLEHYNDNDFAIISEPVIKLKQNDQLWSISALTGEIDDSHQRIILRDKVIVQQQGKTESIRLETEQLEIRPHEQIAKSSQRVRIIQREFNLQSKGMILNSATGEIELLGSVEGNYVQVQ